MMKLLAMCAGCVLVAVYIAGCSGANPERQLPLTGQGGQEISGAPPEGGGALPPSMEGGGGPTSGGGGGQAPPSAPGTGGGGTTSPGGPPRRSGCLAGQVRRGSPPGASQT